MGVEEEANAVGDYYDGKPKPLPPEPPPTLEEIAQYNQEEAAWQNKKAAWEAAYREEQGLAPDAPVPDGPEPPAVPGPPTPGAGMPAARIGDLCAHGGTIVGPGCPTVLIGGMPAVRGMPAMDTAVCPMFNGPVPHVTGTILKGSTTVMIGFMPAARVSDPVGPPAVCAGNAIALGEFTVLIGDAGGGGGGGGGGAGGGGGGGGAGGSPQPGGGATQDGGGATGTIAPVTIEAAILSAQSSPPPETPAQGTCTNPACAEGFQNAADNGTPLVDRDAEGCGPPPEEAAPDSTPVADDTPTAAGSPAGSAATSAEPATDAADPERKPPWIPIAEAELGQKEDKSKTKHNKRVLEYHETTTLRATTDETPWCSSFVNWVMTQAGYKGTNSALAISWAKWGKKVTKPAYGAIAVFHWNPTVNKKGHVGFVVGKEGSRIQVLGGNQKDQVKVSSYSTKSVIAYVFPDDYEVPDDAYDLSAYAGASDEGNPDETR